MAFEAAKGSGPFHCPSCRVNYLSHEVSHLKLDLSDISSTLSSRLASLESKFTSVSEEVASLRPVVNSTAPNVTSHSVPSTSSPQSSLSRSPRHPKVPSPENRKFNLIVSGVPEAPEGQARLSRVNHDFEHVSSIFSELWVPLTLLPFESGTAVIWADSRAAQRIPARVLFWSPWIRCLPWTVYCLGLLLLAPGLLEYGGTCHPKLGLLVRSC